MDLAGRTGVHVNKYTVQRPDGTGRKAFKAATRHHAAIQWAEQTDGIRGVHVVVYQNDRQVWLMELTKTREGYKAEALPAGSLGKTLEAVLQGLLPGFDWQAQDTEDSHEIARWDDEKVGLDTEFSVWFNGLTGWGIDTVTAFESAPETSSLAAAVAELKQTMIRQANRLPGGENEDQV